SFTVGLVLALHRIHDLLPAFSIAGIAVSLWSILCLRVAFAYRYVLDPGWVDQIAVQGIFLSLLAVTLVPSLFLLISHLWEIWHARPSDIARWERWLAYSLTLYWLGAVLAQAHVVRALWPVLPNRYNPQIIDND